MVSNDGSCKMKCRGFCPRPLESTAEFLSKKWTLSILVTIGNFQKLRFNELHDRVEGISAKILSERLEELQGNNLIKRTVFFEKPPRVQYTLTGQGQKLYKAVIPLLKWSERMSRRS